MSASGENLRHANLIRRVIYLLMALAVVVPYVLGLKLPFEPSEWAQKLYQRVDELPKGSRVLLSVDYDPGAQAELAPMTRSILRHCFDKELVPVVMTIQPAAVGLAETLLKEAAADAEKRLGRPMVSGVDFVYLGFRPGDQNLILNMGENMKAAYEKDFYGQPTATMPALEGINSLKDIKLMVQFASGAFSVEWWIAYGSDRFGFPLAVGTTAVNAPDLYPFLKSRQIVGFLGGLRGAADYEALLHVPGEATKGMPAQSSAHLLVVMLVLVANAGLLARRFFRRRKASGSND